MSKEHGTVVASEWGIAIRSFADVTDAVSGCLGRSGLLLTEDDLAPEFFDLRTGLAGELFQKFVNYKLRLAIVLRSLDAHGERFGELAREHRTHGIIRFFLSQDEANSWLASSDLRWRSSLRIPSEDSAL